MIAVVFDKNDKLPKFVSSNYGNSNSMPPDSSFIQSAIDLEGGIPDDYIVVKTNDSNIIERVFRQDEYQYFDEGEVISFDFSLEENKRWIKFQTDSPENMQRMYLDKTSDELFISATMLKSDGVTLDSSFNEKIKIYCVNPHGQKIPIVAKFNFGQHSQRFYPQEFGDYLIPEDVFKCSGNKYRVVNQLKIEVYYEG